MNTGSDYYFDRTGSAGDRGPYADLTGYPEVSDTLEKSPVVLTCAVSVFHVLRGTRAVLGGL